MFAMANAVSMTQTDAATLESKLYAVTEGLKIVLPYETQVGSVRIRGFEAAEEAAAGKFTVSVTTEGTPSTTITFFTGDVAVGDTLRVAYRRRVNGASVATVKTNSTTAKGSLYGAPGRSTPPARTARRARSRAGCTSISPACA